MTAHKSIRPDGDVKTGTLVGIHWNEIACPRLSSISAYAPGPQQASRAFFSAFRACFVCACNISVFVI